ncbi:MAG: two-component system response regulator [Oceanospirillaceae bacterium]|nr:two-component system response regulator [Oceanospirillaceae bacterium]HCI01787.1 two-component system response regulator [Oceanospirillaceae bacterium]
MTTNKRLALIDDDSEILQLLSQYMSQQGYEVSPFTDGESFLAADISQFSLAILDLSLPGIDGLSVCRQLRQSSDLPVIMLTAASDDLDRILGLELGADDYMGKPFNPRELLARVKALLRRVETQASAVNNEIQLFINSQTRTVKVNDQPIALTGTEFDLLAVLAQQQGQIVSKDYISKNLHGRSNSPFERAIDTSISRLRSKLSEFYPDPIQNVRGKGYVLVIPCQ